jgi:nucleoside-triphosphatase
MPNGVAVATAWKRRQVPALRARIEIIKDWRAHRVVLPALSGARLVTEKILLTGRPGCGKTTLIKRIVNNLPRSAGGFYTEEIRDGSTRAGFKIVTLNGKEIVFAHVDFKSPDRVGKYGLDLSALERIGVDAVRQAIQACRLVVIDEIGPMEIRSPIFQDAVNEALDSKVPLLATIFARPLPFTEAIKSRPDVPLIEVRPDNRERLVSELSDRIRALNPG